MRRTNLPNVETLEGRALLAGAGPSSLAVSLTAVSQQTLTGTQVVFTFVETNISQNNVNVALGPSNDGFVVNENGKPVWVSNPGIQPQFLMLQTLKPNQSLTLHATWDGRSNLVNPSDPSKEGPPLTGTFTVDNGLDHVGHATTFSIGKSSTQITPPKPLVHKLH